MGTEPQLSVVLPACREEENLKELLPRLKAVLDGSGLAWEVIVVDAVKVYDGTPEICRLHGVRYVNRTGGDYFGDAIRTGIAEATGKFVVFMDADGSHPPELIPDLLSYREEFDLVAASRYVDGGDTENPKTLIFMSRVLNLIYSVVLDIKCRDISNNFKLYRAGDLKELKLYCSNFDVIEEIIYKLVKKNRALRIKEVPFTFKKRKFGETKRNIIAFMLSFLWTLLRLKFGK